MVLFTGDDHLGHENAIQLCDRPFSSVEEMNSEIIRLWNERVNGNDTVFILGDMFFRCNYAEDILKQLKGKKRLIIGNHDSSWLNKFDVSRYFISIDEYYYGSDGERTFLLCHRPQITYRHENRNNMYMIHGHIHNRTTMDYWPLLCSRERVLNAGVDINGFRPVTFDELYENNQRFKQEYLNSQER